MDKNESKYYNTACLMDEALIQLINEHDYDYITIKEICKRAGVNKVTPISLSNFTWSNLWGSL